MDGITLPGLFEVCRAFGPFGIVVVIWYFDTKNLRNVLASYKEDMGEIRRMYESNVKLVEAYEDVAKDLKDVVILNTQQMTRLSEEVRQNEFCPMQRVDKKKVFQGVDG